MLLLCWRNDWDYIQGKLCGKVKLPVIFSFAAYESTDIKNTIELWIFVHDVNENFLMWLEKFLVCYSSQTKQEITYLGVLKKF